jgi:hypothetical protein
VTIEITHTHAKGTLLTGSVRADAPVIKAAAPGRWRWWRDGGCWYIQRSRDRHADRAVIDATAAALRAQGDDVTVDVDNAWRATEDVVADRVERAGDRAEGLEAKATRKRAEADGHHAASDAISDMIPMGQPILVGHHSEARHRRDLARMHSHDEKGWEAAAQARYAARRAEAARVAASGEHGRSYVTNRINEATAEVRAGLRTLHGWWNRWGQCQTYDTDGRTPRAFPVDPDTDHGQDLAGRIAHHTEVRTYWSDVLAAMGGVSRGDVAKGDYVAHRWGWSKVSRVNAKSVTVPHMMIPSSTMTGPYAEIKKMCKAADLPADVVAALAATKAGAR